jgi:streptogramin lyase
LLAITLIAACAAPAAPPTSAPTDEGPVPTGVGTPLVERLEAEITVPGAPDWPIAAFGSIWVLAPDLPIRPSGGTPNLVRIDPATNEVVATIPVPDRLCQGFVATDDAIWVCAVDAFVRVDPATNAITGTVPITGTQGSYQPVFGGGRVWALGSGSFVSDTVIRLDPATEETATFAMSGPVGGLAFGFGALWLTITRDGTVVRLDPATGEAVVLTTGLPTPRGIAVGTDRLWVSLHGGMEDEAGVGDPQLARLDPTSGQVVAELIIGGSPQGGVEVFAGEGGVFVRSTRPWLVRIDEATGEITETITAEPGIQGPLTVAFGSIWTTAIELDTVWRIAP